MKVAIVTASLGKDKDKLRKNIISVEDQIYQDYIHLIIDASPDGRLKDYIQQCSTLNKKLKYYHLPTGNSPAMTRNAVLYTKYFQQVDAVKWLDEDDCFYSDKSLALMVEVLENPDIQLAFGAQYHYDSNAEIYTRNPTCGHIPTAESALVEETFPFAATIFKKELIMRIGGFNWFESAEDIDLVLRALRVLESNQYAYLDQVLAVYLVGGGEGEKNRSNGAKQSCSRIYRRIYSDSVFQSLLREFKSNYFKCVRKIKENILQKDVIY